MSCTQGLNTGGMGAYAPTPFSSPALLKTIEMDIVKPTLNGMRRSGAPFVGCLFVGLMLTPKGPKVLEYNVRFGDPETEVRVVLALLVVVVPGLTVRCRALQAVMMLLDDETDLLDVLEVWIWRGAHVYGPPECRMGHRRAGVCGGSPGLGACGRARRVCGHRHCCLGGLPRYGPPPLGAAQGGLGLMLITLQAHILRVAK